MKLKIGIETEFLVSTCILKFTAQVNMSRKCLHNQKIDITAKLQLYARVSYINYPKQCSIESIVNAKKKSQNSSKMLKHEFWQSNGLHGIIKVAQFEIESLCYCVLLTFTYAMFCHRFQSCHEVARQALQALTLRSEYELLINSIQVCYETYVTVSRRLE